MITKNDSIFEITLPNFRKVLIYGKNYRIALRKSRLNTRDIFANVKCSTVFKEGYVNRLRAAILKQEMSRTPSERLKLLFSKHIVVFEIPDTLSKDELHRYCQAKNNNDHGEMKRALFAFADRCPCMNRDCLNKVYCPDCPMCGLIKNKKGREEYASV